MRILLAASDAGLRKLIEAVVQGDAGTELVAVARDAADAVTLAKRLNPDIVIVGLHLRDGSGPEAVGEIMIEAPAPTVVVFHGEAADLGHRTARALEAGALAVIPAPALERGRPDPASARKFLSTVAAMAQVKVVRRWRERGSTAAGQPVPRAGPRNPHIVGIVASTGGPAALMSILKQMPPLFPAPILIVQHISPGFLEGVAAHLNEAVPLNVTIARDGAPLQPGTAYLAPDGMQLGVSDKSTIRVTDAPPVHGFRPSGTYLFESIAEAFGPDAVAVVLTGMGSDGVEGLRSIRRAGGTIIAQDEQSSVVYGMPAAAVAAGLVDRLLPLDSIPAEIVDVTGDGR